MLEKARVQQRAPATAFTGGFFVKRAAARVASNGKERYRVALDLGMATTPSQPTGAARRRSQRVFIQTKVIVFGKTAASQQFQEETLTQAVNAHGALVLMKQAMAHGQRLVLTNVTTQEDIECRVVFLGPKQGDQAQIGVEFLKPSPNFWRISFPPEDWKAAGG
jgi:hypothetical protein